MKSGFIKLMIIIPCLFFFNSCGEGDYNKTESSSDIFKEIASNQEITTHNENWQIIPLNASGSVKSTDLSTGETITVSLSSDELGRTDSLSLTMTFVELVNGSYTVDGQFIILRELTSDNHSGRYSFINLPVTYEEEVDENDVPLGSFTRTYSISGDSPLTSSGEPNHSFVITIRREGHIAYYVNAIITDNARNMAYEVDVEIYRVGGNGPDVLYPEII